jgi:hypothetical protein
MVHAALLNLVFTISLKRSTQNLQLSTSSPADYPIFGSKADVTLSNFDVRFTPNSGHPSAQSKRPLWANKRHMYRTWLMALGRSVKRRAIRMTSPERDADTPRRPGCFSDRRSREIDAQRKHGGIEEE